MGQMKEKWYYSEYLVKFPSQRRYLDLYRLNFKLNTCKTQEERDAVIKEQHEREY